MKRRDFGQLVKRTVVTNFAARVTFRGRWEALEFEEAKVAMREREREREIEIGV